MTEDFTPLILNPLPTLHQWSLYADQLRVDMALRDWEIGISDSTCEDDSLATVDCTYGQKRAVVKLCEGFDGLSPEEQRSTLIHELIHCHLNQIQEMGEEDLAQFLSSGEKEMFSRSFRRAIEYAVDSLSTALAPHLPLPSE